GALQHEAHRPTKYGACRRNAQERSAREALASSTTPQAVTRLGYGEPHGCSFICSSQLGTGTSFLFDPCHCISQRSPHFTLAAVVPIEASEFSLRDCFREGRSLVFFRHRDHMLHKVPVDVSPL